MASIWISLDDIPAEDFMSSIVVPLIRSLGENGIHANLEPTENKIIMGEGTLAYQLFPGGELMIVYTTGPGSRYMMAVIRNIPNGLGIIEEDAGESFRRFVSELYEAGLQIGRPQLTEGKSLGKTASVEKINSPQGTKTSESNPVTISVSPADPARRSAPLRTGDTTDRTSTAVTVTANHKRGCYIASAVYGGYDVAQVRVLRRYRDETLESSRLGRSLVRSYYRISPLLVRQMGNQTWCTNVVRVILNELTSRLMSHGVSDAPYNDPE